RKAMKDFTFSDGTFVPEGTIIAAAARALHHDENFYKNVSAVEPFRFADMQGENGEYGKYQFVSTAIEYLPFGHGTHACPGRFFAAAEMKTMLMHIATAYDIKLEDGATRPLVCA
ncbi:cytochrome P450, partial [Boletus edulis]